MSSIFSSPKGEFGVFPVDNGSNRPYRRKIRAPALPIHKDSILCPNITCRADVVTIIAWTLSGFAISTTALTFPICGVGIVKFRLLTEKNPYEIYQRILILEAREYYNRPLKIIKAIMKG
ncbi:hypothetical protein ACSQ67_001155 [Phaseolus vulgaris]